MAMTTGLPPQAYTRDTLVKAIEWLTRQSPAVKERATTADAIVSFYLQACRRASLNEEAPLSGEAFKADLRNLAEGLKQFEDTVAPPTPLRSFAPLQTPVYQEPLLHSVPPPQPAPQPPPLAPIAPPAPPSPPAAPVAAMAASSQPPLSPAGAVVWNVDARSLQAAKEIQTRLNIGSETEALRMLVTLGLERARELFDVNR